MAASTSTNHKLVGNKNDENKTIKEGTKHQLEEKAGIARH